MEAINPYLLPQSEQGWRGLSLEGNSKRKWYTLLHNDQVLVTALLLIPGETSVRHCHESGELSVCYTDPLQPIVKWNPPGVFHAGPDLPVEPAESAAVASGLDATSDPVVGALLERLGSMEQQIKQLHQRIDELSRPSPKPIVLVDIIFPPFKTIIDDPRYGKKTVIGQWFD